MTFELLAGAKILSRLGAIYNLGGLKLLWLSLGYMACSKRRELTKVY